MIVVAVIVIIAIIIFYIATVIGPRRWSLTNKDNANHLQVDEGAGDFFVFSFFFFSFLVEI
jgi:hypothetical protein